MGMGKNARTLYLIDFGLSKVYSNEDWMHIPYRDGRGFVGNMRYAGVNVHCGIGMPINSFRRDLHLTWNVL